MSEVYRELLSSVAHRLSAPGISTGTSVASNSHSGRERSIEFARYTEETWVCSVPGSPENQNYEYGTNSH